MEEKNSEFENTDSFVDLMSRSERKEWERNKKHNIEKDNTIDNNTINENGNEKDEKKESRKDKKKPVKDKKIELNDHVKVEADNIIKDNEPLKPIEEDENEIETRTADLSVGELGKTQILDIKEEMFEDEDISKQSLSPIPFLTLFIIGSFAYLIYIILKSSYNDSIFLFINCGILLFIIIVFGITTICSKKYIKWFTIVNIIMFICFILFNILSILNWNWFEDSKKNANDNEKNASNVEKKMVINNYSCTTAENRIQVNLTETNGYVTNLQRIEIFENESIAIEMKTYFENTDGFMATLNEETLTTEYNFNILDTNQYKIMTKAYNDSFTLETDFSYIENDKIIYSKYKEVELVDFICTKK